MSAEENNELTHISVGPLPNCADCRDLWGDTPLEEWCVEGHISKLGCDLCHSLEQQVVYEGHGLSPDGDLVHIQICEVCQQLLDS